MSLDALLDATQQLQDAQANLEQAISDLTSHNTDLEAHPDIRAILDKILSGDHIYTRQQIVELIEEKLDIHISAEPKDAHASMANQIDELNNALQAALTRIEALENWRNGTDDEDRTELERRIQEVEDRYQPILEALQQSFKEAQEAGNDEIAAAIKTNIETTMNQKTQDIMDVIDAWQKENTPASA